MGRVVDRTGQRFGRLVVIKRVKDHIQPNGSHVVRWLCQCDCGNQSVVSSGELKRTISCGCYAKEINANRVRTHNFSKTKLYNIWCAMKSRCNRKNDLSYKNYGARGITVCEEWKSDFMNFCNWAMANGYQETDTHNTKHTLDRIDVNGNYEPSNCRWADSYTQSNNTTYNVNITYNNETHTLKQWAKILDMKYDTLRNRVVRKGWSVEKAFETPVKKRGNNDK